MQVVEKIGIYNILVGLFGVRANRLGFEHSDNPYNQCDKTACAQNPGPLTAPDLKNKSDGGKGPLGHHRGFLPAYMPYP